MRYGMIYLVVKDFQRSLDFYKKPTNKKSSPKIELDEKIL